MRVSENRGWWEWFEREGEGVKDNERQHARIMIMSCVSLSPPLLVIRSGNRKINQSLILSFTFLIRRSIFDWSLLSHFPLMDIIRLKLQVSQLLRNKERSTFPSNIWTLSLPFISREKEKHDMTNVVTCCERCVMSSLFLSFTDSRVSFCYALK